MLLKLLRFASHKDETSFKCTGAGVQVGLSEHLQPQTCTTMLLANRSFSEKCSNDTQKSIVDSRVLFSHLLALLGKRHPYSKRSLPTNPASKKASEALKQNNTVLQICQKYHVKKKKGSSVRYDRCTPEHPYRSFRSTTPQALPLLYLYPNFSRVSVFALDVTFVTLCTTFVAIDFFPG